MKKIVDKFNTDPNFGKGQEVSKLTPNNSGVPLEESDGEPLLAQVINSKRIPTPTEESVSSSSLASQHVERKSIEEMIKDRFIDGKYRKLIEIIADPEFLKSAYDRIKSKPGNMSPGGDSGKETLDGINYEWFKKASKELRGGTYKFKNPNEESW